METIAAMHGVRRGDQRSLARAVLGVAFGLASLVAVPAVADGSTAVAAASEGEAFVVEKASDIWDLEGAEWPRWGAHDESAKTKVDYGTWPGFMADYADPQGHEGALDFIHVSSRGMGYLASYLFALQKVAVSRLPRDEQLAYWLNLHNARAVEATAMSLRDIAMDDDTTKVLILGKAWREKALTVEGEKLSLVDIERRIVMRQWPDPRVQYGLYMPATGAPGLPVQPFTGANVWAALDVRARDYVNSPRATEFHDGKLHVSALYYWDRFLFPSDASILEHLRRFAGPELKAKLGGVDEIAASYLNWRINSYNSGYDRHQDHGASCPL